MAQFLGSPLFIGLDSNGDPLNGGKLHTYEPGTTTNKASYPTIADAIAGTNANTNPVVLDSRGEAAVVLAGNTKLVLKTSADVTIWTQDNVDDSEDFIDTNGNQLLEFTTTASATNHIGIINAATGNNPIIRAEGEADTGLTFDNESGEEMLILDSVASSVNEFTIKSEAASSAPRISATGGDTDIDIELTPKGTGNLNLTANDFEMGGNSILISASASEQGELRLYEDTDNGSNYMGVKAPAAVTTSTTYILPDGDGTTGQLLQTNGSATLSWVSATTATQAAQAAIEAETNENTYIPPDLLKYNPGVAKAWGYITVSGGTPTLAANYNITSIADTAAGRVTVTIATDFSSVNYAAVANMTGGTSGNSEGAVVESSQAAGSFVIRTLNTNTGADLDNKDMCFAAFGDQ